jgi:heme/copper-type cytochrome/quinol oxidase subunit 2
MTTSVILWICVALAAAIFSLMVWSVATFKSDTQRRDLGAAAYLHSRLVEVLWALIPIAIFVGAALPVQQMLASNSPADQESPQLAAAE